MPHRPPPRFIGISAFRKNLFKLVKIAKRRRLDLHYIVTSHGKPVAKVTFFRRGTRMQDVIRALTSAS